jgi:uncharacterized UBP type Zn finger protein
MRKSRRDSGVEFGFFPGYSPGKCKSAGRSRYGGSTASTCIHLDSIQVTDPPGEIAGCEECLALTMQWVHLRMCQSCGHVGCCDNSPGKHATAHHQATGHPIIRSAEPGEDWSWCYVDEVMFRLGH